MEKKIKQLGDIMPKSNDDRKSIEDKVRDIEERLRRARSGGIDANVIESIQTDLEALKKSVSKEHEPSYFSSSDSVPDEIYKKASATDIVVTWEYKKMHIDRIPENESDELDFKLGSNAFGFKPTFRVTAKQQHLSGLREEIKKEALAIAKKKGYDAVAVDEEDWKVDPPGYSRKQWDLGRYIDVSYRAKALATFYVKK
jgi:hypothetical protein